MKKIKPNRLLLLLIFFVSVSNAQNNSAFKMHRAVDNTLKINQSYTSYTEITPFNAGQILFGLSVSANIQLNSDESLVRFVLVDKNFNEYLIYETYSLLEDKKSLNLNEVCDETDLLNGITPYSVKIEITDANVELLTLGLSTQMLVQSSALSNSDRTRLKNTEKIAKLNKNLKARGKHWTAGMTSISEMSYQERMNLYGSSSFPAGFEYYTGGIIEAGEVLKSATTSQMVEEWDWRNRHGQNWITPVKNQGSCGSCWAFSATGTTEAMFKVYYNRSDLNLDLSEQDVLSCSNAGSCDGGYVTSAINYIKNTGIVDEGTFPYTGTDQACENKGTSPSQQIKISGQTSWGTYPYSKTEDGLKQMLIEKGPLSIIVSDWNHAIVLVGWKVVKEGDVFYTRDLDLATHEITIGAGDPLIGTTVWLMKNSWGQWWGDKGYVYVQSELTNLFAYAIITPVISLIQNYDVICEDKDGDGYYWWGLGEKPAFCNCPDTPDGDDSNPALGPLDEFGNCIVLGNPPLAEFSVSDQNIYIDDEVLFTDESTGGPLTWFWDFGDGGTSTSANPVHQYSTNGIYSVSLVVTNSFGADTINKSDFISVNENIYLKQDSLALVALYNSTDGPNWINNDNWLTGPLNTWYGIALNDSDRVSTISLSNNNLQGVLPEELGTMSALTQLDLSSNSLVEIIPQNWDPNPNLWKLDLSYNQLGGEIPDDWSDFTSLNYLFLGANQLTDSVPDWIAEISRLFYLDFHDNHLFGTFPENWGSLRNLGYLDLSGNELSGGLPDCFSSIPELFYLNLGDNNFSGTIPETWSIIRSIGQLYLYGNQLTGNLPDWMGNWTQLYEVALNNNQFSGTVPTNWSNLSNLWKINLGSNQLEGNLPEFTADSSQTSYLSSIYLDHNNFSGEIPPGWASYYYLHYLNVSNNEISGIIPSELCSLDTLNYLNLSFNYFDVQSCPTIQCMLDKGFVFEDTVQLQKNGYRLLTDCGTVTDYDELAVDITVIDAFCFGDYGMIGIEITGGLGGSYSLGGQTTDALTDSNSYVVMVYNLSTQNFVHDIVLDDEMDSVWLQIPAGEYQVIVEDAAGHDRITDMTVQQPDPLQLDFTVLNIPFCPETESAYIDLEGVGGDPTYYFRIYRNSQLFSDWNESNFYFIPADGNYEFEIMDANGCSKWDSLYLKIPEPILFNVKDITCADATGTASLTIENPEAGMSYFAVYNLFENDQFVVSDTSASFTSQIIIPDLSLNTDSGSNREYLFHVKTNTGCFSDFTMINFYETSPLSVSINELNVNDSTADVQIEVIGGSPPYQVVLDGWEIQNMFQTVTLGEHTVLIQDAHECYAEDTITIEPDLNCPQHFHPVWEGSGVYEPMNIYIVEAKIDREDLLPGDQVGVFDGDVCVGYGKVEQTITHQNLLNIIAGADDGSGSGFTSGHAISYKIWRCNQEKEIDVVDFQCFDNQLNVVTCSAFQSGASSFVQLNGVQRVQFATSLQPGWNLLSIPVSPDSADLEFTFRDLIQQNTLVKVQNENGASLEDLGVFGGWNNTIGELQLTEGYKVKVTEFDSLFCSGMLPGYPYPIPLNPGWNIMGFPSFSYVDGMEVVQPLIDKGTLLKVQNEQGRSIEDLGVYGGWQNFIGDFWAGEGFKIKVADVDTLWIQENYPKSFAIVSDPLTTQHFKTGISGNGVDHMNFNLVGLSDKTLNVGDELAVCDGSTIAGAAVITEDNLRNQLLSVPVSAVDDSGMTGFKEGNSYRIRIWKSSENREVEVEPEYISGPEVFTKNESVILSLEKAVLASVADISKNGVEVKCYPNPFSQEITLEINLSEESSVSVEIFNELGQKIKILATNATYPAGINRMIWNGTNTNNSRVSPGMYFLQVKINGSVLNERIMLRK